MNIVVPIKQVPETSNVKMDPETGTMVRSGVESVINPLDLYAIETALVLREEYGGSVTAISMGPTPAEKALREAIAMGCDDGILVSDRIFGGSDTWATSRTLAVAIRKRGDFDLIVAGERATDGDTAQVGPGIAAWLDVPVATYVARIDGAESASGSGHSTMVLTLERLVEEGYQIIEVSTPALVTVVKEIAAPRLPTLAGKRRARTVDVLVYDAERLQITPQSTGLRGSPTKVVRIATPRVARGGKVVRADGEEGVARAVGDLVVFLEERGLLPGGNR